MTIEYVHPPVDAVPPRLQVATLAAETFDVTVVQTINEAMAVYMIMYCRQFAALGARRREQHLKRFLRYLKARNHSLQLSELTHADGQAFLGALANPFNGSELSLGKKQDYRGALRSFSRFLAGSGIIQPDVFFTLKVE